MDGTGIKGYFYRKSDKEDIPYSEIQPGQDGRYIISDIPGDYSYEIYAEDYCGLKSEKITVNGNINIYKPVELSSDMAIYNEDWSDFLILFCLLKSELWTTQGFENIIDNQGICTDFFIYLTCKTFLKTEIKKYYVQIFCFCLSQRLTR